MDFTASVINEYRRFLYLCAVAGHAVTPSDAVDQAWHLHLCYTRSYWQDLCRDILGLRLHHGPTKGGEAELSKYIAWYEKTLEAYEEIFGVEPPAEVWPASRLRFGAQDFRRVDVSSHFVFRKRHVANLAAGLGLSIMLAGCAAQLASSGGGDMIFFFLIVFIMLIILMAFLKKGGGGGGRGGGGGGCGWFGGGGCGGNSGCSGGSGCGGGGGCGGGD
jgi:hypothetical protein